MNQTDLQDLVDHPNETLDIEYKGWIDIKDPATRAKLAKHIAALANHGGGYLVFGFKDDMTPDNERPADLTLYSRDSINDIVKKYLTPPINIDVAIVRTSDSGFDYPIARVPSHGVTPVCAAASGPEDANKRPQGIVKGTYYVRTIGPASTPIEGVEAWQAVIRRSVLADRDALLKNLNHILSSQTDLPVAVEGPKLEQWHLSAADDFLNYIVRRTSGEAYEVPVNVANYQFSYRLIQENESEITPANLISVLLQANNEVKNVVWTGWSMFFPFSSTEIAPKLVLVELDGRELEVFESNLLEANERSVGLPDFWRVATVGWATMIRIYREDLQPKTGIPKYLAPRLLAQEMTEFLLHVIAMSKHFPSAHSVEIVCQWKGLEGRQIADFDPGIDWHARSSKQNTRKVTGVFTIAEIADSRSSVASKLITPALRLFDGLEASPEWIESLVPSFRKL